MAEIFIKVLNMSITAGWLILAVLILRLFLKKTPRYIICMMWLLVGLRLVLPVSFESVLSIIPDRESFGISVLNEGALSTGTAATSADISILGGNETGFLSGGNSGNTESVLAVKNNIVITGITYAWLVGTLCMLVYALVSYVRLRNRVCTATLLKENVKQSEFVESPFVLGIARPVIYVPYGIEKADMEYIIAHEASHISRGDHIVKMVGFVILSVYWFNPLVWLAYIMFCRDIELACDEKVIKKLDEASRKAYSTALLNCAVNRRTHIIAACPVAFGEVGVKERIKSIMNYKKPGLYIVIAALVVFAVVAVCFMTDPVVKNQEDGNKIYEELAYHGTDENGEQFIEVYSFDKKYILKAKDKNGLKPVVDVIGLPNIVLDTANKKFHFFYDALSSYMNVGSYVIKDDMMIATTDDGLYTYKFKMNGDNLVFVKEGSSSVRIIDSEILGYSIEDGSVFEPDLSVLYRWK